MRMIYNNFKILLTGILVFSITMACSLEKKVTGTWQIASYSESGADGSSANAVNVGTIQFNKNGTGVNDLEYKILGTKSTDKNEFRWTTGEESVTIKTDQESEFAKSWLVMESKLKTQVWKSTDGEGNIQVLKLKKKN